jgi:hypothetical protein
MNNEYDLHDMYLLDDELRKEKNKIMAKDLTGQEFYPNEINGKIQLTISYLKDKDEGRAK